MVRPNVYHKPGEVDKMCCDDDGEINKFDSHDTLDFGDIIIKQMNKNGPELLVNTEHVFKRPLAITHTEKKRDLNFLNGDIINMAIKSLIKTDENKVKSKSNTHVQPKSVTVIKRNTNCNKRKIKCETLTEIEQNKKNHNQEKINSFSIQHGAIKESRGYYESSYNMKPLIKSENDENIDLNLVVLSHEKFCKLYETPLTPYKDQHIIIYDVQINEVDIYQLNNLSHITEHLSFKTNIQYVNGIYYSLNNPEIDKIVEKSKLEIYCCCWYLRERFINVLAPIHPIETIKFMRKEHKCIVNCKCCCRVQTIFELPSNKISLKMYKRNVLFINWCQTKGVRQNCGIKPGIQIILILTYST